MNRTAWAYELRLAAIAFGAAVVLLAITIGLSARSGLALGALSRDVASTAGLDPLTGLQSHLGVLAWWAAAAVALFAWHALRGRSDQRRSLLGGLGLLTALLAADDLLLLHEALLPRYLGIGEKLVLLGYAVAAAAILGRHARVILGSRGALVFVAALGFLALSVLIDLLQQRWASEWRVFAEDGCKLLGIAGWSAFLLQLCGDAVRAQWAGGRAGQA